MELVRRQTLVTSDPIHLPTENAECGNYVNIIKLAKIAQELAVHLQTAMHETAV